MKSHARDIRALLALSMVTLAPAISRADVPRALTQQGRLFDASDKPVNGSVDVVFTIYDGETPATAKSLWIEKRTITFENGYFSVGLGEVTPLDDAALNGEPRWLGIKVGADEEMTPRAAIRSVPYALVAGNVTGAITPASVSIPGVGMVIDGNGKWVGDSTGLVGPQGEPGPMGPPGPSEDMVFRGSIPIISEALELTDTSFTGVGPTGLDLRGAVNAVPPALPGKIRRLRFRVLYSDNLTGNLCNPYDSQWRLARHDVPDAIFHEWSLPGTWSAGDLLHMEVSPFLLFSQIDNESCDSGWDKGTCRLYARIPPTCATAKVFVKSIWLGVYDAAQ